MFCPSCKCEFRPGFTRCASCQTDLVESLSASRARAPSAPAAAAPLLPARMADYCGFLSLDEARKSRDRLHEQGIRSEICIRATPESHGQSGIEEEYWLRVDVNAYRDVVNVLGFDAADASSEDTMSCAQCGHTVAAQESFCPECGARFEGE